MFGRFPARTLGLALLLLGAPAARADDPPAPKAEDEANARAPKPSGLDAIGDELPGPFVPSHPRTTEERNRVEAMRDFAAARSLEGQRRFSDAIEVLEQALQKEPDSVAILRRLSVLSRLRNR